MIEWEIEDGIGLLRLARPPMNALNLDLLQALETALVDAEASPARAVVLTGRGEAFSAGADLFEVLEQGSDYIDAAGRSLSSCFAALFRFPRPMVAAVNGHAIAGGCILASACDRRVGATGDYRIGVTELMVGVPFPTWALEIMRFAVTGSALQELVLLGRTYPPERSLELGLLDELVEPDALLERAVEMANRLARIPTETFALTKRSLRAPVEALVAARAGADDDRIRALWDSPEVRDSIRAFLVKVFGTDRRATR
ncbi:MAG TPA: enoyl-CoA hydratase/isomerase family protein [Actinomycetota bacterium]|nr:enoyl-CoA hydratase/isomerase family protein [Actinomycetota bacterium]